MINRRSVVVGALAMLAVNKVPGERASVVSDADPGTFVFYPKIFMEFDGFTEPVNVWLGKGNVKIGDKEYIGVEGYVETTLTADGIALHFNEIPFLFRGPINNIGACRILMTVADDDGKFINDPLFVFEGRPDRMSVELLGGSCELFLKGDVA